MPVHPKKSEYLASVSEFITFLSENVLTFDQILSHLVLVVFSPLQVEAITMRELKNGNRAVRIGTWGMPEDMVLSHQDVYNLYDKYPSTDTLRYRRTTWINSLPDFGDDYPLLKEYPYTSGAKSFICFPIEKVSTPVAALGIFSRLVINPNAEIESFLKAIGSVLSMHLYHRDFNSREYQVIQGIQQTSYLDLVSPELTERQLVILRLISEDRTNITISELLGYSESTIRQETIKIFAKLQCSGRHEAAQIYREQINPSAENSK